MNAGQGKESKEGKKERRKKKEKNEPSLLVARRYKPLARWYMLTDDFGYGVVIDSGHATTAYVLFFSWLLKLKRTWNYQYISHKVDRAGGN